MTKVNPGGGMLMKLLRALGWLIAAAGILVFLLCMFLLFGRSPGDFEGILMGAAIAGIVIVALPAFVIGITMVAFAKRKLRG